MAELQNTDKPNADKTGQELSLLVLMQSNTATLEDLGKLLIKHIPAITLFGVYPNELKTRSHRNLHPSVYSSLTAIIWKQPRYPSIDKWINCGTSMQ